RLSGGEIVALAGFDQRLNEGNHLPNSLLFACSVEICAFGTDHCRAKITREMQKVAVGDGSEKPFGNESVYLLEHAGVFFRREEDLLAEFEDVHHEVGELRDETGETLASLPEEGVKSGAGEGIN